MANSDYETIRAKIRQNLQAFSGDPQYATLIRQSAVLLNCPEFADQLVAELCPQPFLLVYTNAAPRTGEQVTPEFHLIFAGWRGNAKVEAELIGNINRDGWNSKPDLRHLESGWKFTQTVSLVNGDKNCLPGEYRVEFTCHFLDSHEQVISSWRGSLVFNVTTAGSTEFVIRGGDESVINLAGVDLESVLKRYSRVEIYGGKDALINIQSFISTLKSDDAIQSGGNASITTVRLEPLRGPIIDVKRWCFSGRFDLPSGRRVLVYGRNSVVLGRNRPNHPIEKHTDITSRLHPDVVDQPYPGSEPESMSGRLSRQQLEISISNKQIHFRDPRDPIRQSTYPAYVNYIPLVDKRTLDLAQHAISYSMPLVPGDNPRQSSRQFSLQLKPFGEKGLVSKMADVLRSTIGSPLTETEWLREESGIDALLIERVNTCDTLNGMEAYLLVMGVVLIGSGIDCPFRIDHPDILPYHAMLCHWDGNFHVIPTAGANVAVDGYPLQDGGVRSLNRGSLLKLGNLTLKFDEPTQFGTRPIDTVWV